MNQLTIPSRKFRLGLRASSPLQIILSALDPWCTQMVLIYLLDYHKNMESRRTFPNWIILLACIVLIFHTHSRPTTLGQTVP